MLFNSFVFIFGFLPIVLAATYWLGRWRQPAAKLALTLLSLGFYAWWRPVHLPLLLGSIVFNYIVGGVIQRAYADGRQRSVKTWLTIGVLADVALLGWFKYANFVAYNLGLLVGHDLGLAKITLPLAISFFTFQKIAYLIDSARGDTRRMSFLDFSLFAAFFPQLIAGPIVHYKEVVPQLQGRLFAHRFARNMLIGTVIFAIGLFKKTVIADTLSSYADPLFAAASAGHQFNIASGWLAAITYTLQLYFDFSGYSDMAIGLARMFGVKLPLNFHSPLRAASIIDYWRRWHMTLQRFIVAYIFQPLSLPMNRLAAERGLKGWNAFAVAIGVPTFVTFVAIGIWHGAGWTFVLFGVMHAIYICVNEIWRERRKNRRRALRKQGKTLGDPGAAERAGYHLITLLAIIYGNVMFRAHSVDDALSVWSGMTGLGTLDFTLPALATWGLAATIVVGIAIVALMPNTQQIMRRFDPAYNWKDWAGVAPATVSWTWRPNAAGLFFAAVTLFLGVIFIQRGQAVFLYFNF
ncbi:MAG: MBOAT family protein [Sphingomonadales bacterium]|nr:MBOAT family protein [Sphingomonadales bacterium]